MRFLVILVILLLITLFLNPSRLRKFFLVYALSIGIIGVLVYEGNKYVDIRTTSRILPSQVVIENVRLDPTLQLFLKGRLINKAPEGTIREIKLRLTVYKDTASDHDLGNAAGKDVLGTQEFTVFTRMGPGQDQEIIQKVSVPGLDPGKHPAWELEVVSVKTFLWE
ncbi:hypothetical protein [Desulfoplanes formicivorans]|uniref:DUF2393 domain-containing protein n=1 Tax=Desulfoplanes formicivorans TaxID=1592317 RepID=A0A194AJL3_9BACT|nr:hypothetical protein [Desulfoplanes formicivorans]GAU09246.1 hypothetical protein DPF_1968 [Desulfoplanes formicivorans]